MYRLTPGFDWDKEWRLMTGTEHKQKEERRGPKAAAALSYDHGRDGAPRVVAAGRGRLAEQIELRARETGVPVYKNEELAWTLTGLGVDREIPPALYDVVAQVIAWVYHLEGRTMENRAEEDEYSG